MQPTEAERHAIASQVTHSLEEDLSAADPTLDITAQLSSGSPCKRSDYHHP